MSLAVSSHVGSEPGWCADALIICALERAMPSGPQKQVLSAGLMNTEFLRSLLSTHCTFHINGVS